MDFTFSYWADTWADREQWKPTINVGVTKDLGWVSKSEWKENRVPIAIETSFSNILFSLLPRLLSFRPFLLFFHNPSPFTASVVTKAGPRGQKVSKVFPSNHCFPLRFICQSRALTSLATVKPATYDRASASCKKKKVGTFLRNNSSWRFTINPSFIYVGWLPWCVFHCVQSRRPTPPPSPPPERPHEQETDARFYLGVRSAPTNRSKQFISMETVVHSNTLLCYASVATMAAKKASPCVLQKSFSDPFEIILNVII